MRHAASRTGGEDGWDLRPATIVALAVLFVAWMCWKIWKSDVFWHRNVFSWQFVAVTILGAAVFVGLIAAILWIFERGRWDKE